MNNSSTIVCTLCNDTVEKLVYRYHFDNEQQIIERIKEHNPSWTESDGACGRCADYYHTEIVMKQRMIPEAGPYFPIKSVDDFVILPTGLRIDADAKFTGKGITICFIDSSFYPHPDLTSFKKRIKKIIDITNTKRDKNFFSQTNSCSWHGTMTSVVCAGDGFLSNGLYKGIACDAELILLKVQNDAGRITTENISKALNWVLKNHKKYNIRIVNMSLGDDEPISYKQSEVDKLSEKLIEQGVVIVAAAGNDKSGAIKPPANSPNVIAVGGLDDNNNLNERNQLYHSSFGKTIDGLMKPELIAPAIWIAAPILPGTIEQEEAEALHSILKMPDDKIQEELLKSAKKMQIKDSSFHSTDASFIRTEIINRIQSCKYISPHYMHVDGTSFAAPIVTAVIAQLLEANPQMNPQSIREALFSTAKRIDSFPAERQGYGSVQPRKSLLKILKREVIMKPQVSPFINSKQKTIEFYVRHDCASQISLAGSFNHWSQDVLLMEPGKKGIWKIKIPLLPAGKYQYKFFVDDKVWLEDIDNPYREPDGFHGFNSILIIEN